MILATAIPVGRVPTVQELKDLRDALLKVADGRDEKPQPYELRVDRGMTEMLLTTEGVDDGREWFIEPYARMIFHIHIDAYIVGRGIVGCPG